jgi:predicted dehydrogenase
MSRSDLKVCLVGTKFMGKAHSNGWIKAGNLLDSPMRPVLHTVAARDPKGTEDFKNLFGFENFSTDAMAAVTGDGIDLVDITTPNNFHEELAIAALKAGKHVACEKPLANTLAAAKRMRDAAHNAGGQTFVWFSYRGMPALAHARGLVLAGLIGDIYHTRANYLQGWGGPDTPLVWRFLKEQAGSGAGGDLLTHIIDAAMWITGEDIVKITGADVATFIKERPIPTADSGNISGGEVDEDNVKMGEVTVDDAVTALGRLANGGMVTLEATRLAIGNQNANGIEINGSKGSIRWNAEEPNILLYYNAEDDPQRAGWQRIMCTHDSHPYNGGPWPDAHTVGYEYGFAHLCKLITHSIVGKPLAVPCEMADFDTAYKVQQVLEAIFLSAESESPVLVEGVIG